MNIIKIEELVEAAAAVAKERYQKWMTKGATNSLDEHEGEKDALKN